MIGQGRRLLFAAALAGLLAATVVAAGLAGTASAPSPGDLVQPAAIPAAPDAVEIEATPVSSGPEKRQTAIGVIVDVRGQRVGIRVKGHDQPIIVNVRPATRLLVNRQPATLGDYRRGDIVVVMAAAGPQGNLVARSMNVLRGPGAERRLAQ